MAREEFPKGYELLETIGKGAGSVIYRAREEASGNIVAIKHVSVDGRENSKYLRHMLNEYETLHSLQDGPDGFPPNGIVKVYRLIRRGLLRRRKDYALVMEYVDGPDLARERRYPLGQMVDIMTQAAGAISQLHRRGILHGDVKPDNVIINSHGHATLIDFGFSCRAGSIAQSIRGTRDYMAPEQVDMGRLTERTDIYNFGAMMYFLLTGQHVTAIMPAQNDTAGSVWYRFIKPPRPQSLNPDVPDLLDQAIMQCVRKDVQKRPSRIEEVMDVLSEIRDRFLD